MKLADYTYGQLLDELALRDGALGMPQPMLQGAVIWDAVYTIASSYCQELYDATHNKGRYPKDFDHYLMEAVIAAIFGSDVWTWINEHIR